MVAFYADSFGTRPSTIWSQQRLLNERLENDDSSTNMNDDFTNAMTLSFSNVRRALTNNDVSFEDVSAEQQRDHASCGIFALENAHRFALTINLRIV
jgi:hypothetical protein